MRCVIQRVSKACVRVNNNVIANIGIGALALVGIGINDTEDDIEWLTEKIIGLRIFEDNEGKMNLSLQQISGEILLVSQFTLYGDCRKGKRPSFSDAAPPDFAKELFEKLVKTVLDRNIKVKTGKFQANMNVELINNGPVTVLLDSKRKF